MRGAFPWWRLAAACILCIGGIAALVWLVETWL